VALPGSPLRFFEKDGTESTRRKHSAPPLLNQDGAGIRAWISSRSTR
jgi:hypothetical protein